MNSLYAGKTLTFKPKTKNNDLSWDVTIFGMDMGGKVTLHDIAGKTVVLKVAGHTYSVGWGATDYIPAHFLILRTTEQILLEKDRQSTGTIESFVHEFPAKRQKG